MRACLSLWFVIDSQMPVVGRKLEVVVSTFQKLAFARLNRCSLIWDISHPISDLDSVCSLYSITYMADYPPSPYVGLSFIAGEM